MANAHTTIVIKHDSATPTQSVVDRLAKVASHKREALQALINELHGYLSGSLNARISLKIDDVTTGDRASTTVTCASVIATDVLNIGPVTLTVSDSPSGENQVATGGDDGAMADNFAAAINAHSILSGNVTATSDGVDTVTVTSALPGLIGEFIATSSPDATITVNDAYLTGITSTSSEIVRDHEFGVA